MFLTHCPCTDASVFPPACLLFHLHLTVNLVLISKIEACVCMQCAGSATSVGTAPSSRSAHLTPQTCFKEILHVYGIVLWCSEGTEGVNSIIWNGLWIDATWQAVSDSSLLGLNHFLIDDYRVTCYALSKRTRWGSLEAVWSTVS